MKRLCLYLLLILTLPFSLLSQTTRTVGATGADYATLKAAFDAIYAGTITGAITLQIIDNTIETSTAVLNASGSGSANYTSVKIYPTVSGLTISGNLATPLINFNGADNVTIDGRLNESGSDIDLTITNTSTSNTAGTSTIRFINDATTNIIKYCTLKGSSTATAGGILFFSTATSGVTGNDGNTVDYNNITSDAAGRPVNAIYSSGTSTKANSENIISNNNIYNFLRHGTSSYGINLGSGSSAWSISGNSFYETTSFVPTASVEYNIIRINNGSGTDFIVSGNFIGGRSALCGGTAWTKTNTFDNTFYAIYVNVGDGVVTSFQGNTIKKFNWSNSGSAPWTVIHILTGAVNIGTVTGNIIGATTGTGSILITGGATGTIVYGINIVSTGTVNCQNNTIGSITTSNTSTNSSSFYGINKTASTGTTIIRNNFVGSATTANSINSGSASSGDIQVVHGIHNASLGDVTISENIIANLSNATSNSAGSVSGLHFSGSTGTNEVSRNFIHSISATGGATTASIYGIRVEAGITTYSNNIIFLDGNTSSAIYGIYESGASDESYLYYNTVYLAGTPTSGAFNSYALFNNSDANTRDFRNNIFFNARSNSGATGKHYAISLAGSTLLIDYNNYFSTGAGGVLGELGGDQATIANWQSATGQDVNSYNIDPLFTSPGSTIAADYKIAATLTAIDGTGITNDFGFNSRGISPSMGAWESTVNKWKGSINTNWNDPGNWTAGIVPDIDANIFFDAAPDNDCYLDQNRSVSNITNESGKNILLTGKTLTFKGNLNFTSSGRINAYATGSAVSYSGTSAQSIEIGQYLMDSIYNLTIANPSLVTLNSNLKIAHNLTINPSAKLEISAAKYVTVNGTSANSGTLRLRSTSLGTASLITPTASGTGTTIAERYMTPDVWHNLSSPVSAPNSLQIFIANLENAVPQKPVDPPDDYFGMGYYDEGSGKWVYYNSSSYLSKSFSAGQGYITRRSNVGGNVCIFSGLLNAGTININITRTRNGWNAVGNPYTSSIYFNQPASSQNFIDANVAQLDPSFAAGYFWDETLIPASYQIINNTYSATSLQSGQGFIVKSKTDGGTINFTPSFQLHGNPTFYKKSSSSGWDKMMLYVKSGSEIASTIILFREDMTRNLDITYDAGQFGGNSKFLLYSRLVEDNGINFAIQCLPSTEKDSLVIPIGFDCTNGGLVSFNAEIISLPFGYTAVIEDRQLGTFTDLTLPETKYEVTLESGTFGTGRFYLHAFAGPNGLIIPESQAITTYSVKTEIYIKGHVSSGSTASVYDILGRKIADYSLNPSGMNILQADTYKEGIYIVKVSDKGVLKTDKVFISE